jgi:RNA polymerase sigma-70 factor (ECF subfamily)
MSEASPSEHLSRLSTHWPELIEAQGNHETAPAAQCAVLRRYWGAIYHYLEAATGDSNAAEDLSQEFALRFVRGDFHHLDPRRGRFRDFVRRVLQNLIADHFRARRAAPHPLPHDSAIVSAGAPGPTAADAEFERRWRGELLDRAWDELRQAQAQAGSPFYTALRWRAEHPDLQAAAGAEELCRQLGRPVTADAFRQTVHRAREKFADLLLAEVSFSLGTDDTELIGQELADLGLLTYCRPALARRPVGFDPEP